MRMRMEMELLQSKVMQKVAICPGESSFGGSCLISAVRSNHEGVDRRPHVTWNEYDCCEDEDV